MKRLSLHRDGPITNRPQVVNLPHKCFRIDVRVENFLEGRERREAATGPEAYRTWLFKSAHKVPQADTQNIALSDLPQPRHNVTPQNRLAGAVPL
jgi:hypothetical protein